MVVFTCNNCGDSVNKPKVEKHIQYECKRKNFAVSFCCVDCLKDFNYETVKDHCQCVTEDQRYAAKGYVPKPSAEKGKRKQAGWVDIVQSVMNNKNLPNEQRQFLNIIAKFDNVPRKKNKFQNFCFSTAPAYRKKGYIIDQVFDMIEAEFKAQLPQNSNEKPVVNKSENLVKNDLIQEESQEIKKNTSIENVEIIKNLNGNNGTEETPKKKKKKSKKSFDEVIDKTESKLNGNVELQLVEKKNIAEEDQPSSVKKSKKNKKNMENIENNESIQEPQEIKRKKIIDSETEETPKKKKKKSKKSFDEVIDKTKSKLNGNVELQLVEKKNIAEEDQSSSVKKSKKKKKSMENIENNESIQEPQEIKRKNIIDSETVETPKKKKKKSKKSFDEVIDKTKSKLNGNVELQLVEKKNNIEDQPSSVKKSKKNKKNMENIENIENNEPIQEPQEIKKKKIIDSETPNSNFSCEETLKKKKKVKNH